jgi:hypothetical protein
MPILESEITYETMRKYEKTHCCSVCEGRLSTAWSAKDNCHILRCHDLSHTGIEKINPIPKYLRSEVMNSKGTELANIDKAGMLQRIEGAKFPTQLTRPEKEMLAQAAVDYGLDPLTGELTIYQGRLYVTIDGRIRKAHETKKFDGIESRPANKAEREARGTPPENKLWRSDVYRSGCTRAFTGWGEVLEREMKGNAFLPVVSFSDRMAEKRSQQQALRLAFYLPLPGIEEAGVETESPKVIITETGTKVDTSTGEIKESTPAENPPTSDAVEGEFTEQDTTLTAEVPTAAPQEATEPVKDETPVTNDQLIELEKLLKEANLTNTELAKYAKGKEKGWKFQAWKDLHVWQFTDLKAYLLKAAGH